MKISLGKLRKLRKIIQQAITSLDDETALGGIELFPQWEVNHNYQINQRIQYNGKLYRVVQAHTSQNNWTPDVVPALFSQVALPDEIPVWRQPIGAQDVYQKGDKVRYPDENGPIYISIVDNNSWAPTVYGWELV